MQPEQTYHFWQLIYYIVIGGVVLYVAFWVINTVKLPQMTTTATVQNKEYKEAHDTYSTTYVYDGRGRPQRLTIPTKVPEMFIFVFEIEGQTMKFAVPKEMYDSTEIGGTIEIRYSHTRITKSLKLYSVQPVSGPQN